MPKTIYRPEYRQLLSDLRDRRESLGLSQMAVAKALHYSQTTFSAIERGARRLDVLEYIALSRLLGLSPADALAMAEVKNRKRGR